MYHFPLHLAAALLPLGLASLSASAATLASTSFEGTGLAYTLTGEFDQVGSGFTDYFKVLPNNGTRVDSVIIPLGVFAGGDGANCLMSEDTDSLSATVPGLVTFAAVNTTGHQNLALQVLLAATGVQGNALPSPRGFDFDANISFRDRLVIQANVDGAGFQTLATFVPEAGGFNTYLSLDTNGDNQGNAGSAIAATAIEQAFKNFSFTLPNAASVVVRIELIGNATGEYIAIDHVRITGDPVAGAAPVLAGMTVAPLDYTEGDPATLLAPLLTVSDTDSANLSSAEITITGNYTAGEDQLVYTPINGVTVLSNTGGILTLTGNRPLSDYQAALRTVRYQNTNLTNPTTAQRTIAFRVNDGSTFSNSPFRQVNVINTLLAHTIPYTEAFDDALGTGHRYGLAGGFDLGPNDFFARIAASENATRFGTPFTGVVGAGFFGSEGISANGIGEGSVTLSLNSTGYGNLAVNLLLAAESLIPSFDAGDFLVVEYQFGGAGPFLPLITFRPTGGFNTTLAVDTNNDGAGDGAVLTAALAPFSLPIPATGPGLRVRVRAATTSLEEEIAFDEFGVTGNVISQPPVVSGLTGAPFAYTEGAAPLVLGAGITVTDPDDANMESASVSFSSNFAPGQDVLAVTASGGITFAYDANTGVLSLSGTASKAAYETVLSTLTYRNTDLRHPSELPRTVLVRVNDGDSDSNNGILTVNVSDVVPRLRLPFCETFSTDGRGTRFRAANFFEVDADNLFNRSILPRATGSLTGLGSPDPYAWVAEDTDAVTNGVTSLAFDLNSTGFSNLSLTLDLAAAPAQFDSPDQILVEQSVNGGAFQVVAAFRPVVFNSSLSLDADNNGLGDGVAVLGNAFTTHTFPLTSGPNTVLRLTVHASGTSEEIAIGTVCVTGTPSLAAPQPLLYYNFEEGSGTAIQNLGTLGGTGTLLGSGGNERWVSGAPAGATPGRALQFDGENLPSGDAVDTGFSATQLGIANNDSYTTAAWINFTKPTGDTMVFSQINQTGQVLHNGVRGSRAHLGHWGNDVTGASVLQTGVWYHVVWLYDEGWQSIYVNGNRDVGPLQRGLLANVGNIVIGNAGPVDWGFKGALDEVVIFDEALNYGQILALANGGAPAALPPATPQNAGIFFTAPFGPGGTWNLYELVGVNAGVPATWYDAEVLASTKPNPYGAGAQVGHLPTLESREEQYTLSYLAGMRTLWIGLTDDHTVFGGAEANTNPNNGWVWTSRLASTFRAWGAGEPNNAGDEDSSVLFGNGVWNDSWTGIPEAPASPGQVLLPYMIEWNLAAAAPIPGAPVVGPVLPADLAGPTGGTGAFGVLAVKDNGPLTHIRAAAESVLSGAGTRLTGTAPAINHADPEAPNRGVFMPDETILGNTAAVDPAIAHVYKGLLQVQTAGPYTFAVNADDAFALRLRGASWTGVNGYNVMIDHLSPGDTMFADRDAYVSTAFGRVTLAVGFYELEFLVYQDGSNAGHEVMVARGDFTALADTPDWRLVGHVSVGTIARPGIQGAGFTVTTSAPGGPALNNLADAQTQITATGTTSTHPNINFTDPDNAGGGGSFAPNTPFPRGANGVDEEDFAVQVEATVTIPVEGDYVFGYRSDDGASLQIVGQFWLGIVDSVDGVSVIAGDTVKYDQNTGDSFTRAKIHLTAGTHTLRGLYWERAGGAHYELFGDTALNAQTRLLAAGAETSYPDPDGLRLIAPPRMHVMPYNSANHSFPLIWDSSPGVNYRMEYSFNLPNWILHPATVTGASGATTSATFGGLAPFERVYFRVRTE